MSLCSLCARVFTLLLLAGAASAQPLPPDAQRLFEKAKAGKGFANADKLAPTILPTSDRRSYYAVWKPSSAMPKRWLISLHGSKGFATDDLATWHRYASANGIGLISLQWWLGAEQGPLAYYTPQQIYSELDLAMEHLGVRPGTAMLYGSGRGSANMYAVAALDSSMATHFFSLFVADGGRASIDYPPNLALVTGRFGPKPLHHTHWITVCGENDPKAERDGCAGMQATRDWLETLGGKVDAVIEDPSAGQDALPGQPRNVAKVLAIFESDVSKLSLDSH